MHNSLLHHLENGQNNQIYRVHHLNSEKNFHADNVRVLPWVPGLHVDQAPVLDLHRLHHLPQAHYGIRQLDQDGQLHLSNYKRTLVGAV